MNDAARRTLLADMAALALGRRVRINRKGAALPKGSTFMVEGTEIVGLELVLLTDGHRIPAKSCSFA